MQGNIILSSISEAQATNISINHFPFQSLDFQKMLHYTHAYVPDIHDIHLMGIHQMNGDVQASQMT